MRRPSEIPQNLSTPVDNPHPGRLGVGGRRGPHPPRGRTGRTIAPGFSTVRGTAALLTHFLLSTPPSWDVSVYFPLRPAGSRPSFRKGTDDGQGKAHVSAEHPPPGEDPRLPSSDANAGRPGDPRREAAEGPQPPQRFRLSETVRTAGIQRVFRDGQPVHGKRVVAVRRARLRRTRADRRQEDRRRGAAEPSPASPPSGAP